MNVENNACPVMDAVARIISAEGRFGISGAVVLSRFILPSAGAQIAAQEQGSSFAAAAGVKIAKARRRRGLTLAALAAESGFSAAYLSLVERGKRNLKLAGLERIAAALGLSPRVFF